MSNIMAEDKKKYNAMEPVLNNINRSFVSLSDADTKRNNNILKALLDLIIAKMKEKDSLFKEMFSRVFFGGSFYDGLRIGYPNEFDLDLLLSLPKSVKPTITTSNVPGYVHVHLQDFQNFMKQAELVARYKGIDKLLTEKHFLDTSKVLRWMESVVTVALNDLEKQDKFYILKTGYGIFQAKVCKGGPAFTLKVRDTDGKNIELDIDLVPCFVFGKEKWPVNGFRANPIKQKPEFFIVPKPLKGVNNSNVYWRLSFQEQERILIDGQKTLKPTVKLLKKLRDNLNHKCIASYYLKTILLWQSVETRDEEFWNNSLSYVFMTILKDYQRCLCDAKIRYFWNKNNNLIGNVKKETIVNMSNKIKAIVADIEKHPEDPLVVAKYLLSESERTKFQTEVSSNSTANMLVKLKL